MNLLLKIYLIGVVFNLLLLLFEYIRGYKQINVNVKGIITFIILSWLIYLLLFLENKIHSDKS